MLLLRQDGFFDGGESLVVNTLWSYRELLVLPIIPTRGSMGRASARLSILGFLCLSVIAMPGCGGQPVGTVPAPGFINHTQHSDAQLSALWSAAQQTLSQKIDLNPLARELYNSAPNILPGDVRVWNVLPHQLQVESQADVSSPVLQQAWCAPIPQD